MTTGTEERCATCGHMFYFHRDARMGELRHCRYNPCGCEVYVPPAKPEPERAQRLRCRYGHEWTGMLSDALQGKGCPKCGHHTNTVPVRRDENGRDITWPVTRAKPDPTKECGHPRASATPDGRFCLNTKPCVEHDTCAVFDGHSGPCVPAETTGANAATPARTHSLERTSLLGEAFIGRCTLCGATDLMSSAALESCRNPCGVSEDDALLRAINGAGVPPAETSAPERCALCPHEKHSGMACLERDETQAGNTCQCLSERRPTKEEIADLRRRYNVPESAETSAPVVERCKAPFTHDQVRSLNDYQVSGVFHEFTCGHDGCRAALVATVRGWICPFDEYTQNWAHVWMADGSWQQNVFAIPPAASPSPEPAMRDIEPEIVKAVDEEFWPLVGASPSPATPEKPEIVRRIDGKFGINAAGQIVKMSSGEVVPDDEPLLLMRGRDRLALATIAHYRRLCQLDGCNDFQLAAVDELIERFVAYASDPRQMKQPGITRGAAWNPDEASPATPFTGAEHEFASVALDGSSDSCGIVILSGLKCGMPRYARIHFVSPATPERDDALERFAYEIHESFHVACPSYVRPGCIDFIKRKAMRIFAKEFANGR